MPTYYPKRTTVQLALVDLQATTTTEPITGSDFNNEEFALGSMQGTLKELPVSQKKPDTSLSFIGFDHSIPFYMVNSGVELYDQSLDKAHTRKPERVPETEKTKAYKSYSLTSMSEGKPFGNAKDSHVDPKTEIQDDHQRRQPKDVKPFGLVLTVFLTSDSFLLSRKQGSKRNVFGDVKIDVFFNGELCGSTFVAERYHTIRYEMAEHIVRFSGRKIGRLVEKPWVIVPPDQNPDGTFREDHRGEEAYAGAQPRWTAISEALEAEAKRIGRDEFGAFSLLGEYLTALANLAMPPGVEEMQKAGSREFGMVDVVVIAGKGVKDDSKCPALIEPKALRLMAKKPEVHQYDTNAPKHIPKYIPHPLSQNSVLTYAEDGLVRGVKLERNGWFEEKEVVMGVRFLVG